MFLFFILWHIKLAFSVVFETEIWCFVSSFAIKFPFIPNCFNDKSLINRQYKMIQILVLLRTFCFTQPHIWYYCIIGTIESEDLLQVFSIYYIVRYYWVSRLDDCNGTRSHNHLVRKRILNHLAKLPVCVNGWVFVYELNRCGFESRCNHLNFRYRACFERGVLWHSSNYRVWIHSKMRTWHDKNIQSSRLNIAINSVPKYGYMSETINLLKPNVPII